MMQFYLKKMVLILVVAFGLLSFNKKTSDFEIVKDRVKTELMKSPIDDFKVKTILDKIKKDGSFKDINYLDLSTTAGFPHRKHTSRLVYLAKAYKNKTSKYYQDIAFKKTITSSFKYWVDHDFFGDNWHNNQITTPTNLVNLMLIIGYELPKDLVQKAQPIIGRAHMNASGARPSGDRIVIAGILAKNLLFMEEKQAFSEIIKLIEGEMKFRAGQRGMQHDYSFHHRLDRVNNTVSYGYKKYANAFGEWSYYVSNTDFSFSKDGINHLIDYYLDGIYKQLVYGVYTDVSVKNRSITRKTTFEPKEIVEIERLLQSTNYRKEELEQIIKLRKGEVNPSLSFSKFFWQTEHFVFQRPKFYTTVRMFSSRNNNMEVPHNGPGKLNHHRADGTNHVVLKGDEYLNIWPVYDWQKIPGTTIMQKPALYGPEEVQKEGLTDFVGAVTDGLYGAVAMEFKSPHDLLSAKKAWFFFDDEYVCLGAGINSRPDLPVVTTINQVLLKTDVTIKQNNSVRKLTNGHHEFDSVKWVYQDNIAYLFPEPTSVFVSNKTALGRWSDITDQKNISEEIVSENVFTLGFNHGNKPIDGSYQYIVMPSISETALIETKNFNNGVKILSNTVDLQGVKNEKLGICQLAFYKAGIIEVTTGFEFGMSSQGMAMLKMIGNNVVALTLSDPSRKLQSLLITIPGIHTITGNHFKVLPNTSQNNSQIIVDLPQGIYAGKSITIEF